MNEPLEGIQQLVEESSYIVIIQADNPDADSLGSAIAMEQILTALGKECTMYCGVDMPSYLHYLKGWGRVEKYLPKTFDTVIIVDASTDTLLEKIKVDSRHNLYQQSKKIVLDHHESVQAVIDAEYSICKPELSSTGEVIYDVAQASKWPLNIEAHEAIFASIMGDTQGLSNNLASPQTFRVIAELIEAGVDRLALDDERRAYSKMPVLIYNYKAQLIQNTRFVIDNKIAYVVVTQDQINTYSPLYNPAAVIQSDMLQTEHVKVSMVIKTYTDGKITAAIRCNNGAPVAAKLAEHFGGGGHAYASGFKCTDGTNVDDIIRKSIDKVTELLNNISYETV